MEYFTRYELKENGSIKEIKVPRSEVEKHIDRILRRDKEMLDILEKL